MTGVGLLPRLRSSRGRRLALAFLAVPAVLIGLLTMHVLSAASMNAPTTSTAMVAHHASDPAASAPMAGDPVPVMGHEAPAPAEGCGGSCGPDHTMLGMICVLALLASVLLLTLQLTRIPWGEMRRMITALIADPAALAPPRPPSLLVLSISRT